MAFGVDVYDSALQHIIVYFMILQYMIIYYRALQSSIYIWVAFRVWSCCFRLEFQVSRSGTLGEGPFSKKPCSVGEYAIADLDATHVQT